MNEIARISKKGNYSQFVAFVVYLVVTKLAIQGYEVTMT